MSANVFVGEPCGQALWFDDVEAYNNGWRLQRGVYGARRGTLLYGDAAATNKGVLTIDPKLRGSHAIYVGCFSPSGRQFGIYVRLSGEPHFAYIQMHRWESSFECMYFKTADLTGRTIEIAGFERDACLDYVMCQPVKRGVLPGATKKTLGILDFADEAGFSRPVGYEAGSAVRRHIECGYDAIMWKAYAVRCEYHTKIGEVRLYSDAHEAAVKADGLAAQNAGIGDVLRKYDTMRQAVDVAKEIGVPIFGWARINNEFSKKNHQFSADTWFHQQNPDKFQLGKDGSKSCKLSFAYPEVRKHKIDILKEIASYGMTGIFIDVLRHPPLVTYDLPIVNAYIEKTGKDPRQMDGDGSEDWLRFRAEHTFTLFLREVKAAIAPLPLYVRTVDQPWRNLQVGCDVETWIDDRIVDGIVFGPHCADATNYPDTLPIQSYIDRAKGRVAVFGQVWRYGSVLHAEAMAKELYAMGADGVALYESNATVAMPAFRERLWKMSRPGVL